MSSPSSSKVDDFLSSLSSMSQQKLSEDSQRQRQLQRNIDELRSKSNSVSPVRPPPKPARPLAADVSNKKLTDIPSIKFNRSGSRSGTGMTAGSEDKPPPMPLRRADIDRDEGPAPRLPMRKPSRPDRPTYVDNEEGSAPRLPTRKSSRPERPPRHADVEPKQSADLVDLNLDLVRPVAPKSSVAPRGASGSTYDILKEVQAPSTYNFQAKSSNKQANPEPTYNSFTHMEKSIKTGGVRNLDDHMPLKSKPPVPIRSSNGGWLSSSLDNSKTASTVQAQSIVKPRHLDIIAATGSARNSSTYSNSGASTSPTHKQQYIPQDNGPNAIKIIQSSPKRERNSMSWLDSAVNKSPEQPNRGIIVVKNRNPPVAPSPARSALESTQEKKPEASKPPKPERKFEKSLNKLEVEEPKSEALSQLEKLRKSPIKAGGSGETLEDDRLEYLKRFDRMKNSSLTSSLDKSPTKSSILKYEEQDSKMIREQLDKAKNFKGKSEIAKDGATPPLKPAKPARPSVISYEQKDSEILRSQMKKLNSRPTLGRKEEDQPEGLKALANLKAAKPPAKPAAPKTEALKKFEDLKSRHNVVAAKEAEEEKPREDPSASFQNKLSNILRANTLPRLDGKEEKSSSPGVHRSSTFPKSASKSNEKRLDTAGAKLSHATKTRSKGPKRKLPGSMKKSGTSGSTNTQPSSTTSLSSATPDPAQATIPDFKKKAPPIVNREGKRNALENLKPSRNFSGELFI
ncbi:hypothetical protein CLIB1423_02S06964 [[Candida] railenensis]|uniref:Uncharacterized protein n=1 Tax=[Candida] railenensis TaxID=45579 RepID=A0A9P0VWE9_9ASCO|nr:hypothetical protein CLIB1423_02S06964 [[Candida] railenensis]